MTPSAPADPNALLTQAIEKLLYLESRLEASEAANDALARDRDRHREAARDARRSLTEWQRRAVHAEVATEGAEREVNVLRATLGEARDQLRQRPDDHELTSRLTDAEAHLARLQAERETWLDRMIALGRLRGDDDTLDLGGFIAELRAELIALRSGQTGRSAATIAQPPRRPDPRALVEAAKVPEIDLDLLVRDLRLPRAEKTLAALCARDLAAGTAQTRRRAAARLREAGIAAFNPWIAQRLAVEPDAGVREEYVRLLDGTGRDAVSVALEQAQHDADPRVRAAALEGLARRGVPAATVALSDASPALRRRALARLPRDPKSIDHLADALRDDDPGVRRVAVTVLSGRVGPEAVAVLRVAARLADPEVHLLARAALEARGIDLDAPETVDAAPPEPAPEAAPEPAPAPAAVPVVTEVVTLEAAPPDDMGVPVPDEEPAPLDLQNADEMVVLDEVRRAIRGRTAEELTELTGVPGDAVQAAAERLVASGQLVWRGRKLWPA